MLSNILSYHAFPAESTVRSWFPSDSAYQCHLNVLELLRLFYCFVFEIHHLERTPRPSESIPCSMIVFKNWDLAVLLCEIACCILLNVRSNNDRPQLLAVVIWKTLEALLSTSSEFDPFCRWSQASQVISAPWISAFGSLPLFPTLNSSLFSCSHIVALSSPSLTFTVFPLMLSTSLLLSSLSLCPPAQPLWVKGSVSFFWKPAMAMIRWVREWINTRNITRIFTSFHQTGLTGYSYPIMPRACGSHLTEGLPLRWNSWEQEIGRQQFYLPSVRCPPHSPQRPPCSTVPTTRCLERAQPTSRKHPLRDKSEVDALAKV